VLWSVCNQDGERSYSKEECLQEPEELSLAVCDSFIPENEREKFKHQNFKNGTIWFHEKP
jgi:hypothetical protein